MIIFDLHNDLLTSNLTNFQRSTFIEAQHKRGINIVLALWTSYFSDFSPALATKIVKPFQKYQNIAFAMEDIRHLDFNNIEDFMKFPFAYYGISWNDDTKICGGCNSNRGLTDFGKEIVAILLKNNKIIDLAHANSQVIEDVFAIANKENVIINSHCCLNSVFKHRRNIDDDVIKEIISRKGIVGITFVKDFFFDNKQLFIKNFVYFIENFGEHNIGIGSDYFGSNKFLGICKHYKQLYRLFSILIENVGLTNANNIFWRNAKKFFERTNRMQNFLDCTN